MVLCSGAFDGIHAGHIRYLTAAHALAPDQMLCVAIAPDAYIREAKGRAPYWHQADRAYAVLALGVVDRVLPHQTPSVASVIRSERPRLFVKGPDWKHQLPADVIEACRDVGCAIRFTETPGTHVAEARG